MQINPNLELLIQDLNHNFTKKADGRNYNECIKIINQIFQLIKTNDEIYNLFLDELEKNFLIYFKNLIKNNISRNHTNEISSDELLKEKVSIKNLEKKLIDYILNSIKPEIAVLKKNELQNKIERSDLTISGGAKIRNIINILNKELSLNGHMNSVSSYLGQKSWISGLAIELSSEKSNWWKHQKNTKEPKTLAVHLDKDFASIKSILYLTDVNENSGPFSVYPYIYENLKLNIAQDIVGRIIHETAINTKIKKLVNYFNFKNKAQPFLSENFKKIYNSIPKNITFDSHFGWELNADSKEEKEILEKKKTILGGAGTLITFDGSTLFHSGGLVKKGNRLVFQIIYSKKENIYFHYLKKIKNKYLNF